MPNIFCEFFDDGKPFFEGEESMSSQLMAWTKLVSLVSLVLGSVFLSGYATACVFMN